jgi:hypothetical protein
MIGDEMLEHQPQPQPASSQQAPNYAANASSNKSSGYGKDEQPFRP